MAITFNDKDYNGAAFLDALIANGIEPNAVRVRTNGNGYALSVDVLTDDSDGAIAQMIQNVAATHDATALSDVAKIEQDRDQIVNLFDLDASDRKFIRDLSQVLTLAETNTVSASRSYDEIRAVVVASDKHRVGVAYWYNLEYGINLLGGVTLTIDDKRNFVKCVRRYYATKLAPALIVWLMRGGLDAAPSSGLVSG